jgi:EpsI family protein
MITRRNMVIVGLSLGAAGLAEALMPRKRMILLRDATISMLLPKDFQTWSSTTTEGLVKPEQAGKLARTLYKEIVGLVYHDTQSGADVMLLAAYGDTQSDLLQLHRPEVCYPAVGFSLTSSQAGKVRLNENTDLPVRRVVATMEGRNENITYWTRLGETLPQSEHDQRMARFKNALHGYVADGILVRCSIVGESAACFQILDNFIPRLLDAVPAKGRSAFIGSGLAGGMAASSRKS